MRFIKNPITSLSNIESKQHRNLVINMNSQNVLTPNSNNTKALTRRNEADHLSTMIKLSALMNSSLEITTIRERAIRAASTLLRCQASSLLMINDETGGLYFDVATGENGDVVKKIELQRGEGIAGWVAENKRGIIIKDAQNDPRFFKKADKKSGFITQNMVCVPVLNKDKTIGVLQAINKNEETFTKDDAQLLVALANQIAVALENARLYDELKMSLYSAVSMLTNTIEKRDPYSAGHSKRVARYAVAIGKQLEMPREDLVNLKLAAILHDVGMIAVPDNILNKKNRLSDSEKDEVMKHMDIGEEIVGNIKALKNIMPAIKYHHERYDGRGHFGLIGEEIPLIARIIAVADSFDSMTNERPYARCKGYDAALRELVIQSDRKFDAEVVDAFLGSKAYRHAHRHLK